jgi:hypothetical protein
MLLYVLVAVLPDDFERDPGRHQAAAQSCSIAPGDGKAGGET